MSYTITHTNGTTLTVIPDGQINQTASDLTLVGKNATSYGGFFNDNFIRLLENFANTSQPNYPTVGQLWYDTSENRLKVYTGNSFAGTSGTIVSSTPPSGITIGDIWIDDANGQLYFNDGLSTKLAGPLYTTSQGVSGFNIESVIDINGQNHTVAVLYVAGTILGIFSKDTFIPANPIAGFTNIAQFIGYQTNNVLTVKSISSGSLSSGQIISGTSILANTQITTQLTGDTGSIGTYTVSTSATVGTSANPITLTATSDVIKIGFNSSSYPGVIFNAIASEANALLASDGSLKTAESFLTVDGNSTTNGSIIIQNNNPLTLGINSNFSLKVNANTNTFQIQSNVINQNFDINLQTAGSLQTAMHFDTQHQRVGVYNISPQAMLDVAGDVIIAGNLTVNGTMETISSTTVTIADKNIVLGQTQTPTDTTANGGGITIAGQTSKTITWSSTANTSSSSSNAGYWNFSDFVNVGSSGTSAGYYLNGQPAVTVNTNNTQFSLGSNITGSSLTSVGALTNLQVSNLYVNGSTVSYVNGSQSNGTVYLAPKGNGTVDVSGARISNLQAPLSSLDAVNQQYVITEVTTAPLGIGLVTTGYTDNTIASVLLTKIFPPSDHGNGTICRVQCSDGQYREYQLVGGSWSWQLTQPFV
jgi:hypothetical protein